MTFSWSPQVKKHGIAGLGESLPAGLALEDAPLATRREIGRDGADVAAIHQLVMFAARIGARLVPGFGFVHRFLLGGARDEPNYTRIQPFCLFQSTSG